MLFVLTLIPAYSIHQVSAADDAALLKDVPYVWQEINGFCTWAAESTVLQYFNLDLSLHDLFAATTIGFSWAYIKYQDSMLIIPGALYQQVEPTKFMADLYGLNFSIYLDSSLPGAENAQQIWQKEGVSVGLLDDETQAFALLRATIDRGTPLILSVDPSWLPEDDYDYLREHDISGGGHAIVMVGYNDSTGVATIVDPGVGSFGENFGYPSDGRGNYTEITYTALNSAWKARGYITMVLEPMGDPVTDIADRLGPLVRDKLLGVSTSYNAYSASAYLWKYGETGFRQMSSDLTPDGLTQFLSQFKDRNDSDTFIASALVFIGVGLESQLTLQYLSYRKALEALPRLLPEQNLTDFVEAGSLALPHFQALASNISLIEPLNLTLHDSLAFKTFYNISAEFNKTLDIEQSLKDYSDELAIIDNHLLAIADSWKAAGQALAEIWPNDPFVLYGPYLILAGLGLGVTVIYVVWRITKRPSQ